MREKERGRESDWSRYLFSYSRCKREREKVTRENKKSQVSATREKGRSHEATWMHVRLVRKGKGDRESSMLFTYLLCVKKYSSERCICIGKNGELVNRVKIKIPVYCQERTPHSVWRWWKTARGTGWLMHLSPAHTDAHAHTQTLVHWYTVVTVVHSCETVVRSIGIPLFTR